MESYCYFHSNNEAKYKCRWCGRVLCEQCLIYNKNKKYYSCKNNDDCLTYQGNEYKPKSVPTIEKERLNIVNNIIDEIWYYPNANRGIRPNYYGKELEQKIIEYKNIDLKSPLTELVKLIDTTKAIDILNKIYSTMSSLDSYKTPDYAKAQKEKIGKIITPSITLNLVTTNNIEYVVNYLNNYEHINVDTDETKKFIKYILAGLKDYIVNNVASISDQQLELLTVFDLETTSSGYDRDNDIRWDNVKTNYLDCKNIREFVEKELESRKLRISKT
jgi:hypothetical protein